MPKVKKEIGYNAIFPTRLRQAMEEKGVKYQDLALAAGVRRQAVGQWCLGNTAPDVISIEKITRLLGVSADWLIGLSDIAYKGQQEIKPLQKVILEISGEVKIQIKQKCEEEEK